MISRITTFLRFPLSHQLLIFKASCLLIAVNTSLKLFGFKKTRGLLGKLHRSVSESTESESKMATRIANYVYLSSERIPFTGQCLGRSLVTHLLLQRQGIESEIIFGTKKASGLMEAHSWIEIEGVPLGHDGQRKHEFASFTASQIV